MFWLLPLILTGCYSANSYYPYDEYTPYQTVEDICPSGFVASEGIYGVTAGPMKVNLPTADFDMGTPQITVALFDVDEKIELSLDASVAVLDFGRGVREGLINNPENNIVFTRGEAGYIKGAGCNGPGNFNWFFERNADKVVISRDLSNSNSYTFMLMFKRDPDGFQNTYDYSISGSFTVE